MDGTSTKKMSKKDVFAKYKKVLVSFPDFSLSEIKRIRVHLWLKTV
jgi:hypothetical protein